MIPVIFKIEAGNCMDVKKFLGDDPASQVKHLPDGLIQRLTAQIQSYENEGADALIKKVRSPKGAPEIYKMTHIFKVKQLKAPNDPNIASKDNSSNGSFDKLL